MINLNITKNQYNTLVNAMCYTINSINNLLSSEETDAGRAQLINEQDKLIALLHEFDVQLTLRHVSKGDSK